MTGTTITRKSASRFVSPCRRARTADRWAHGRRGAVVFTVFICVCLSIATSTVGARTPAGPLLLAQATPSISADEAAALVREKSGGRILGVRRDNDAGPPVYRVKVLLEGGRVRVYQVDASSGRILQ